MLRTQPGRFSTNGRATLRQIIGATSAHGEYPIDRTLGPADILATIYGQLGINYRTEFTNGEGRPIKLLSEGEPIKELV